MGAPNVSVSLETLPEPLANIPRSRWPRHIAIIMDGNGRWAQRHRLPRVEGHRRGVRTVRQVTEQCARLGIEQLTLYCLSSENWKRPPKELDFLMQLLRQYLIEERRRILQEGIRLRMIGRRQGLPPEVLRELDRTMEMSRNNSGMVLCLAINYGGRCELVDAVRAIARDVQAGRLDPAQIDEERIARYLYTCDMPDPDLLIRTAGEMRVSNFLLWQSSYTEFWTTPRCWPEFELDDLHQAIADFSRRQRRFGGLQPQEAFPRWNDAHQPQFPDQHN